MPPLAATERGRLPQRRTTAVARTLGAVLVGLFVTLLVAGLAALVTPGQVAALPVPPEPITPPELPEPIAPPQIDQIPGVPGFPGQADIPDDGTGGGFEVTFPDVVNETSNTVIIILLLTVLSVAPSLLVLLTAFTRIVIVLSLTRNAIGIPQIPPQQVVVGLALFLTLFVMGPTLAEMNEVALQPMLAGELTLGEAYDAFQVPLREFLMRHTREAELALFLDVSNTQTPIARDEVPLQALVPAFVLSELKTGFIIGFVIFVPFLVIDLVVSAVLMGLGMMMLPPSFVSLPFKLLLFVMLDGWTLVVGTLLRSYA